MTPEGVLEELRGLKLLTIQDYDKINPLDRAVDHGGSWSRVNAPIDEYDRNYPQRLKEYLGIDLLIANSDELNQEIGKVSEEKAEEIADIWIDEAKEVRRGVTREDVIRAAGLYLALKKLIERYNADAITMASWHLAGHSNKEPVTNVMPPLSWMELSKEHIPCSCESLIDCLVTQTIGACLTEGHAGFVGDILNDWVDWPSRLRGADPGDVVIVGHCGAPITPHGDDRIPYTIRDHVISGADWAKLFEPEETVTATTVDWPSDEVCSIVKFDVYRKKVFVCTGTVLDGDALYESFSDTVCRNKMVVRIDDPEVYHAFPNKFRRDWGIHPVVFYGDLREEIRSFAELIGFDVMA
ncbi:MAG: hypothetical protein U9Q78_00810 [Chloroflexota bacterium]|nr:hypothetical protein [Chloroflexota bacterium]